MGISNCANRYDHTSSFRSLTGGWVAEACVKDVEFAGSVGEHGVSGGFEGLPCRGLVLYMMNVDILAVLCDFQLVSGQRGICG